MCANWFHYPFLSLFTHTHTCPFTSYQAAARTMPGAVVGHQTGGRQLNRQNSRSPCQPRRSECDADFHFHLLIPLPCSADESHQNVPATKPPDFSRLPRTVRALARRAGFGPLTLVLTTPASPLVTFHPRPPTHTTRDLIVASRKQLGEVRGGSANVVGI